jgi:hypothetical protein
MGGYYLITIMGVWAANANGRRQTYILKNSVQLLAAGTIVGTSVGVTGHNGSAIINLSAGDYFELCVTQNSGGALDFYKRDIDAPVTVAYLGA